MCCNSVKLITSIPLDPRILTLIDKGKSVLEDPESEVAQKYAHLSKEVVAAFEQK